jgi:heat shock protein HslJ
MRILLALAASVVLLTACGSDGDGDSDAFDLDGTTYTSRKVSGRDLVAGSNVNLSFDDGRMAVKAGCNTQTGDYKVSDGRLKWTAPAEATRTACPTADLADQDQWLADLFTTGMDASLEDGTLTLSNDDVELVLSSR